MSGHFAQEEDRPAVGKAAWVGALSLLLFCGGSLGFISILRSDERALHAKSAAAPASEVGKAEVGIVNQLPFDIDSRTARRRDADRQRLESYGWVDRRHGIIHIPIAKAMDLVVSGDGGGAHPVPGGQAP